MEASQTANPADVTELAAELYLVPPERFVVVRDDVVRAARRAGFREVAEELHRLRRPTLSAWLVNVLARYEREAMRELAALGRDLRAAQTALDGPELRRLSVRRRELVYELVELARGQAADAGIRLTERTLGEVEATLHAALVDLAASSAALSGRLARPMVHNGFGPRPQLAGGQPEAPPRAAARAQVLTLTPARPATPATPAPTGAAPAAQAAEDGSDEWVFWPVQPDGGSRSGAPLRTLAESRLVEGRRSEADLAPPGCPPNRAVRRLRLVGGPAQLPQAPTSGGTETELAAAETEHWRCEQELAAAEEALRSAREELDWFEEHRMVARSEKAAAEQRLAQARAAQRASVRALSAARRALEAAEARATDRPED